MSHVEELAEIIDTDAIECAECGVRGDLILTFGGEEVRLPDVAANPDHCEGEAACWCLWESPRHGRIPALRFARVTDRTVARLRFDLHEAVASALWRFELDRELAGQATNSYVGSLREKRRVVEWPVADLLVLLAREIRIRRSFEPSVAATQPWESPPSPSFSVALTHDVDVMTKDYAVRFKKAGALASMSGGALLRGRLASGLSKLTWAWKMGVRAADYDTVPEILAMEKEFGFDSTFFFSVSGSARKGARERIVEPTYSLDDAKETLDRVRVAGGEIGLHGSTDSALDGARLKQERELLERYSAAPVSACRFHWLSFSHRETPRALAESGIVVDSTLGFVDAPGFRSGTARPFDLPLSRSGSGVAEVPLIFMDMSMFFRPSVPAADEIASQAIMLLDRARRFGGTVAINWHIESFAEDYGWAPAYRQILDWLRRERIPAGPLRSVL